MKFLKAIIAILTILLMGCCVPVGFICRAIQRGFEGGVGIFDAHGEETLEDPDEEER
ncbi:hypothetical protein JIN84_18035 [Luteolibacter yonseiensis]|uniref:Lipoprotein n=1 Tax=Luteolibacter yonseiensis TaxID=1144680 RepID=A0A934R5F6_9BACT|nr:hypothetical protein [Luteolibacter yonseiensis]MBK1817526.1 hypothetical protein [Luteolibacter yonseiensis]